jgi:hypothetical protein
MGNEDQWRKLVNDLPPEFEIGGADFPELEKIDTKSPKNYTDNSVIVYKLTTEVYVYQHIGSDDSWYGANTLQDVTILGEMTLDQVRTLVNAKKLKRKKQ